MTFPLRFIKEGPPLSVKQLASTPWNEIDLFHSIMRFRNPKPTRTITGTSPFCYSDKNHCRFVDTFTKKDYIDVVNGNRSVCFVYNTGWLFKPSRWLNKNRVTVDLSINIFGLSSQDNDSGCDLRSIETLSAWVQEANLTRKAMFDKVNCVQHDNGMMSVEFNDQPALPSSPLAEPSSLQRHKINGLHWVQANEPNQVCFSTPISKEDALCFSFMVYSGEAVGVPFTISSEMQKQITAFIHAMLNSVSLTPSTRMDAFLKGKHISGQA